MGKERWKRWGFSAGRGRRKTVHIWGLDAVWVGEGCGREEGRIWGLSTGGALQVGWTWGLGWRAGADLGGLLVKFKTRHWVHFPDPFKRLRVRRRSTQSSVMKATEAARQLCGPPWLLKNQIWPAVKKGWEPLVYRMNKDIHGRFCNYIRSAALAFCSPQQSRRTDGCMYNVACCCMRRPNNPYYSAGRYAGCRLLFMNAILCTDNKDLVQSHRLGKAWCHYSIYNYTDYIPSVRLIGRCGTSQVPVAVNLAIAKDPCSREIL